MSDSKPRIDSIETAETEVELSAQDLLELSGPCDNNNLAQEPVAKALAIAAVPTAPTVQRRAAPATPRRQSLSTTVTASLIVAVGTIGAALFVMGSNDSSNRSAARGQASPSQPASAAQGESTPVRFANPFDEKEVFEFPSGTSEAQARDKVAEILMERAMERQRKFDARVSNNS